MFGMIKSHEKGKTFFYRRECPFNQTLRPYQIANMLVTVPAAAVVERRDCLYCTIRTDDHHRA